MRCFSYVNHQSIICAFFLIFNQSVCERWTPSSPSKSTQVKSQDLERKENTIVLFISRHKNEVKFHKKTRTQPSNIHVTFRVSVSNSLFFQKIRSASVRPSWRRSWVPSRGWPPRSPWCLGTKKTTFFWRFCLGMTFIFWISICIYCISYHIHIFYTYDIYDDVSFDIYIYMLDWTGCQLKLLPFSGKKQAVSGISKLSTMSFLFPERTFIISAFAT